MQYCAETTLIYCYPQRTVCAISKARKEREVQHRPVGEGIPRRKGPSGSSGPPTTVVVVVVVEEGGAGEVRSRFALNLICFQRVDDRAGGTHDRLGPSVLAAVGTQL